MQILDTNTGEIRTESLVDGELLVQITHFSVNLDTKHALVEYVHRGTKAVGIEHFINAIIKEQLDYPDVEAS